MKNFVNDIISLKKQDNIPALNLQQLQHEKNTWKRWLGLMMDENILQKNRLSEILKYNFNENLLEEAESLQSNFIKEDELIGLLRNDVAELDRLLMREIFEDEKVINEVDIKIYKLRNNMLTAEKLFCMWKSAFNAYLSGNM